MLLRDGQTTCIGGTSEASIYSSPICYHLFITEVAPTSLLWVLGALPSSPRWCIALPTLIKDHCYFSSWKDVIAYYEKVNFKGGRVRHPCPTKHGSKILPGQNPLTPKGSIPAQVLSLIIRPNKVQKAEKSTKWTLSLSTGYKLLKTRSVFIFLFSAQLSQHLMTVHLGWGRPVTGWNWCPYMIGPDWLSPLCYSLPSTKSDNLTSYNGQLQHACLYQ